MIGSFFGGAIGRAAKGAVGGAVYGGITSGGDFGNMAGGAIGGALMGGIGGHYAKRMMANKSGAGMLAAGMERVGWGIPAAAAKTGSRRVFNAAMRAKTGMTTAAGYIGRNAVSINKWGGRGAMAAGVASGAYIGSSMVNSNRGY